jgi:hypothetical protein
LFFLVVSDFIVFVGFGLFLAGTAWTELARGGKCGAPL